MYLQILKTESFEPVSFLRATNFHQLQVSFTEKAFDLCKIIFDRAMKAQNDLSPELANGWALLAQ